MRSPNLDRYEFTAFALKRIASNQSIEAGRKGSRLFLSVKRRNAGRQEEIVFDLWNFTTCYNFVTQLSHKS
jgi:hypothetical protein